MTRDLPSSLNELDEDALRALYGRWDPLTPHDVAALFEGSGVRWWIVGGRAARIGAAPRRHEDTDVAVRIADLPTVRQRLRDWHLWEAHDGCLRPLLPGRDLPAGREQLWLRRDAHHPWALDLLLHASDDMWVFKKDARVRLSWDQALHSVAGITYLRPELAILHKAHLNRPKDRADLAAVELTTSARVWLGNTLDLLGYTDWADAIRSGRQRADP